VVESVLEGGGQLLPNSVLLPSQPVVSWKPRSVAALWSASTGKYFRRADDRQWKWPARKRLRSAITHHVHDWPLSTAQVFASILPKIIPLQPTMSCFNSFLECFRLPLPPERLLFLLGFFFFFPLSETLSPPPCFLLVNSYLAIRLQLKCYFLKVRCEEPWVSCLDN